MITTAQKITIADKTDFEVAPCLREGSLSENARKFIAASRELGNAAYASVLRAWCVPYLFHTMEELLADGGDPFVGVNSALEKLTEFFAVTKTGGFEILSTKINLKAPENIDRNRDVKTITGDHYGNLFKSFSKLSYWDEPVKLLKQRLERNGIAVSEIEGKKVLDAGCGGGRYAVAWRLLGASPVVGLDISPINIKDANRRTTEAEIGDISFKNGDVLDLPFEDNEFDIVFSNGVLHHTTDWEKGVAELVRVLKPGGLGWLYLITNPGGVFWDVIEILRLLMKDEQKSTARAALRAINIPANRIFYMLDHVMVPINLRLAPSEVRDCLIKSGATEIRRLERGADFDRIEHIYKQSEYAKEHFGAGENRYVFSK